MKAAIYRAPGDIVLEERDEERLGDDEILVDVRAASLCGTDVRIFRNGHFKIPTPTRRVLGHEVAGVIAEVGRLVAGYRPGMRVSFTPNIGCGVCEMCRQGYNNMCPDYEAFGISVDGGFQERMRVPAAAIRGGNVFEIPPELSFEEAAVVEPLSCCYNAFKGLAVSPEASVLIIGPGPIGACFVQLSRLWGARRIIVAGRSDARLAEIERFGADVLVNTTTTDLRREVEAATRGRGVDVAITAASAPELQPLAIELLATHGRVNFFGGLAKGTMVSLDTNRVHYRGLTLTGTTGSSNEDYDRSLRLASSGQINLRDIVSHRYGLGDIARAFETAAGGKAMKTMIVGA
jgi:threonine dehydrogenase-like Zn-dependent dehydrogenase